MLPVSSTFCHLWLFYCSAPTLFPLLIKCVENLCQMHFKGGVCECACAGRMPVHAGSTADVLHGRQGRQRQSKGHTQHRVINRVPRNLISRTKSDQRRGRGRRDGKLRGKKNEGSERWGEEEVAEKDLNEKNPIRWRRSDAYLDL